MGHATPYASLLASAWRTIISWPVETIDLRQATIRLGGAIGESGRAVSRLVPAAWAIISRRRNVTQVAIAGHTDVLREHQGGHKVWQPHFRSNSRA